MTARPPTSSHHIPSPLFAIVIIRLHFPKYGYKMLLYSQNWPTNGMLYLKWAKSVVCWHEKLTHTSEEKPLPFHSNITGNSPTNQNGLLKKTPIITPNYINVFFNHSLSPFIAGEIIINHHQPLPRPCCPQLPPPAVPLVPPAMRPPPAPSPRCPAPGAAPVLARRRRRRGRPGRGRRPWRGAGSPRSPRSPRAWGHRNQGLLNVPWLGYIGHHLIVAIKKTINT